MMQSIGDPQTFLKRFFGKGNEIQWEQYESGAPTDPVRSYLEPWVQRFQQQQSPFLLPRVDPESKQTAWYVLCKDPREARSMRETLQAFIGPTYAEFNGELANLAETDSIDQLCKQYFGPLIFRLRISDRKERATVNTLLGTLIAYRDREFTRSLTAVKPIGRLLRDLEMAILAGNEDSAWHVYAEIRGRGRLSATNLAFLQVRIFGAFEHWTEILSMPNLNDLLQVRRPKRISEQIAKAVYRQFLIKHEGANDAATAIETYRSVGVRYQVLVRSIEGFRSSDAIKFALVAAVAADPPDREVAEQIAQNTAIETDADWTSALLATIPPTPTHNAVAEATTTYDLAEVRYNENRFDEAFALYLGQAASYRSVCRVLETAVEVDTPLSAEQAIEYLSNAPEDIQGKVLGRRVCANHVETLTSILGQDSDGESKPISSLTEWFQRLDDEQGLENASQVLEYGIRDWTKGSAFDSSLTAARLQQSRSGRPAELIRNAVPVFIRALLVDRPPSREFKPVYNALIELLIYDESIGADDLAAVEQLVEVVLTTAPSHEAGNNDFIFAVDVTLHLWDAIASPRHFDWSLSMLDLLIDTGAQQHTNLTPILAAIVESSRAWPRRISDDQWALLELLASDLNLAELLVGLRPEPETETEGEKRDVRGLLNGKSIAVYSLTERIARRFGQLAEQAFDGIKINYIHDKSLTDRMKSLAKTADIFVVNTWDAKHAATNGIKYNRPDSSITLEPKNKSPSALLEALIIFCSNNFRSSEA